MNPARAWYALMVKPRHEKSATAALGRRGFQTLLPVYKALHKWSDRVKKVELPLFTGYTFCRFAPEERSAIVMAPGVVLIVGGVAGITPVEESEIAALETLMRTELAREPWDSVERGEEVNIVAGPLKGITGTVIEVKQEAHLLLTVSLLQRSVVVAIDRSWAVPVKQEAGDRRKTTRH